MKRPILTLAGKELRDVLRERSLVIMVLIQFFVAAFSAFMLVGLSSLYDPGSIQGLPPSTIAYVGDGGFDDHLADADNLDIVRLSGTEAFDRFHDGTVTAVIEEDQESPDAFVIITVVLPVDDVQSSLLVNQLKELLLEYEKELRLERQDRLQHDVVYAESDVEARTDAVFGYTVLLPLLVLTPVFLSGAIGSDSFSQEIEGHTLSLLRAAPVSIPTLLVGKLLVPVLLVPIQASLWVALLHLNGFPIHNIPTLLLFTLVAGILIASVGAWIAFRVRRAGQAQTLFALVSLVLALASALLPRDPLNLVARLGSGSVDATAWLTIASIAAMALAVLATASWDITRSLRRGDA